MILRKEFYSAKSLKEDVEELCNKETPITVERLANVISKYIACLIGASVREKMPYESFRGLMSEVKNELLSRRSYDCESLIKSLQYQLEMIFDIPATIEVMRDIISMIEQGGARYGKTFRGIDLGSGSGILMLAQYVGARRAGIKDTEIMGIEFEDVPQFQSKVLILKLGIGDVKLGSVLDNGNYPGENPDAVSIELLPTTGAPFLHFHPLSKGGGEDYEPFLETVSTLSHLYGREAFTNMHIFPRGLEIGSIFSPNVKRGHSENIFGLENGNNIGRTASASHYPKLILIGDTWKRLDEVGENSYLNMFEGGRSFRRWSFLSEGVLASIYRNQRSRVNGSGFLHI